MVVDKAKVLAALRDAFGSGECESKPKQTANYFDDDFLTDAAIDGHYNLDAMAERIAKQLNEAGHAR